VTPSLLTLTVLVLAAYRLGLSDRIVTLALWMGDANVVVAR
jgi:hypothetical protein